MKKILLRCALFGLLIVPLPVALEILARKLPNVYKEKRDMLLSGKDSVEVLIHGASHFDGRINPHAFEQYAVNFAIIGQSHRYDYLLLKRYIDSLPRLRVVILPVGYFHICYDLERGINPNFICKYQIYSGCSEHGVLSKYSYELGSSTDWRKAIYNYFRGRYVALGAKGWKDNVPPGFTDDVKRQLLRGTAPAAQRAELFALNFSYLRQMAELCQRHRVRLLLVSAPVMEAYYAGFDKEQLRLLYVAVDSLRAGYDNVSYVNYMRDERFVAPADFADVSHVSRQGAAKLSAILAEEVKR
ncbi:MAG: hypothetical protein LBS63_01115 [Prevotellaceae bacterium]|jgi:hypothetical protein|nr:hypothetical protein [Prevotellaceae bacterium]